MGKYKVVMAVEIAGKSYGYGDVVELDMQTALDFADALQAVEGEEK